MSRPLITTACRAALLMMSRAPISYNRTLIAVEAIHELTARSYESFMEPGLTPSRVRRMQRLINGRRRQMFDMLRDAGHMSIKGPYASVLDAMDRIRSLAQAAAAEAAMNEVLSKHGL